MSSTKISIVAWLVCAVTPFLSTSAFAQSLVETRAVTLPCGQWQMNLITEAKQNGQQANINTGWTSQRLIPAGGGVVGNGNEISTTSNKAYAAAGIEGNGACQVPNPQSLYVHFRFYDKGGANNLGDDEKIEISSAGWQPSWSTTLIVPSGFIPVTIGYSVNVALREGAHCRWTIGTQVVDLGSNGILSDKKIRLEPGKTYNVGLDCPDASPLKGVSHLDGQVSDWQSVSISLIRL